MHRELYEKFGLTHPADEALSTKAQLEFFVEERKKKIQRHKEEIKRLEEESENLTKAGPRENINRLARIDQEIDALDNVIREEHEVIDDIEKRLRDGKYSPA